MSKIGGSWKTTDFDPTCFETLPPTTHQNIRHNCLIIYAHPSKFKILIVPLVFLDLYRRLNLKLDVSLDLSVGLY